ncbi:hypothetical protein V8B55DRAFT_1147435 [Mucor lusitanicus]|uniref:Uncharacterized protein n=1 Tax=Mucor lusitanicus CBS 277.49 TaxID=747725 RepID=A0A168QGP8_MUCCL|nr:hypothetical protein MUCCIDRAFT_106198 [Mucor lusitanicus CBS 277.49]
MDYNRVINWRNLEGYWYLVCASYAISHQKKFIKDSNVVDWDDLANQITRKHMEIDARQESYDMHAKINEVVMNQAVSGYYYIWN